MCLDDQPQPSIYVCATTAYGDMSTSPYPAGGLGPAGPAGVYKLDGVTGDVSVFLTTGSGTPGTNELPGTGAPGTSVPPPGLGNICHDPVHNQFFVSDFDDGLIYRIDSNGIILSVFDPFGSLPDAISFVPLGERIWGVQVYDGTPVLQRLAARFGPPDHAVEPRGRTGAGQSEQLDLVGWRCIRRRATSTARSSSRSSCRICTRHPTHSSRIRSLISRSLLTARCCLANGP